MSEKIFHICSIIAESEEDYLSLLEHLGRYPISITKNFPEDSFFDSPTLMVGWEYVKHRFPKQNILDKNIYNKLFWSFSKSENEKTFIAQAEQFFIDSMKAWLPKNFILYDSYINSETLKEFLDCNLCKEKKTYIFFNNGALYLNNDGNNFIINIKALSSHDSDFKNTITDVMNEFDIVALSFHNFGDYINSERLKNIITIDNIRWIKSAVETEESYFNIIPNFEIKKYIPFLMSKLGMPRLDSEEMNFYERMFQRDKATHWMSSREVAFSPIFNNSKLNFKIRKNCKLAKINYSNKRTKTGRIASRDVYNPQNLEREGDERKDIISRFEGGEILVFDYISFETKISLFLCECEEFIEKYHDKDLHHETAEILFSEQEINSEQRAFSKIINHALLYGAGENTLIKKLQEKVSNPEEKLYYIRKFLKPIIDKSEKIKQEYKLNGYLINPWGYIIRVTESHASYNNYIQSYASEIVVDKILEIKDFLKKYKSQFIFQVHDSLVFDLHPEESFLIEKIKEILSKHKEMSFGILSNIGKNYKELQES